MNVICPRAMLHKHADGMLDSAGPNQTKQHEPGLY